MQMQCMGYSTPVIYKPKNSIKVSMGTCCGIIHKSTGRSNACSAKAFALVDLRRLQQ